MIKFFAKNIIRTAALPPDIKIQLDGVENKIMQFLRDCIASQAKPLVLRIAGGWVRDKLLGKPSKDIDITVEGMTGIEFANLAKYYAQNAFGPGQNIVGTVKDTEARPEDIKNLAVAFVRIYGQDVELLNLRGQEVYQEGSRNPVSVDMNASAEQDAFRRDLSINSLFYNINTDRIEDFTGHGYDDLSTMTLRTPLDPIQTFRDDPLRLLRVIRFYSKYSNAKIAPEVLQAMKDETVQRQIVNKMIDTNSVGAIVPERVAIEFRKIMSGQQPDKAVRILYETGLLDRMLNLPPEFHPLNMNQMNKHHKLSVIDHSIQVLRNVNDLCREYELDEDDRMKMNIASLFHDLGKLDPRSHNGKVDGERGYSGDPNNPNSLTHQQSSGDVWGRFALALKLSEEETSFIKDVVLQHMNPHAHIEGNASDATDKQLRRYLRKNPSWFFQYIHATADAMSKQEETNQQSGIPYRQNIDRLRGLLPGMDSYGRMSPAQDLLNGQEIMRIVGLPPKPPLGMVGYIEIVKEKIREAQDENPSMTKNDAILLIQNMISAGQFSAYQRT